MGWGGVIGGGAGGVGYNTVYRLRRIAGNSQLPIDADIYTHTYFLLCLLSLYKIYMCMCESVCVSVCEREKKGIRIRVCIFVL